MVITEIPHFISTLEEKSL